MALLIRNVTRVAHFAAAQVLARSEPVRLQGPNDPQHLHLAIANAAGCALPWRSKGPQDCKATCLQGSYSSYICIKP